MTNMQMVVALEQEVAAKQGFGIRIVQAGEQFICEVYGFGPGARNGIRPKWFAPTRWLLPPTALEEVLAALRRDGLGVICIGSHPLLQEKQDRPVYSKPNRA